MINRVVIEGRLVADPEVKTSKSGKDYSKFNIAVNSYGDKAEYFTIMAWDKAVEPIAGASKGQVVVVDGRLQQNVWEDKDGNKRYDVQVAAYAISTHARSSKAAPKQADDDEIDF